MSDKRLISSVDKNLNQPKRGLFRRLRLFSSDGAVPEHSLNYQISALFRSGRMTFGRVEARSFYQSGDQRRLRNIQFRSVLPVIVQRRTLDPDEIIPEICSV